MGNENTISVKLKLDDIIDSPNVAKLLPEEYLKALGRKVTDGYKVDLQSRSQWEERNAQALKLALQVAEVKNFPWVNCSNVKFPLVTVAALQFLSRVSMLTRGKNLVRFETIGADPDGKKAKQAERISEHMNLQLTEEDADWIEDDEKTKLSCAIMGTAFKKSHFDFIDGCNDSEFVPAAHFVVDYWTTDLEKCRRATHWMALDSNRIKAYERREMFLPMEGGMPTMVSFRELQAVHDEVQGTQRPAQGDDSHMAQSLYYPILEQHCWLDLDGDGYEEPYIVTVREDTNQVLRVVARFTGVGDIKRVKDYHVRTLENMAKEAEEAGDMKKASELEQEANAADTSEDNHIVDIKPMKCFTRYLFIPSPDGGFYGLGLGALLGPVNKSVDSIINQMIDSGTMAVTAGGFLGRGIKLKAGKASFDPFEWKPVDTPGSDLKDNIFPLPVREPSDVLFRLLGLLIEYGEKIGSSTEVMSGINPGQNTPAETSRNTLEQGMALFTGIYGRMYRGFREELKVLFQLNQLFLQSTEHYRDLTSGPNAILAKDDYITNALRIFPSADPSVSSKSQQQAKADRLMAAAHAEPGFNRYKVVRGWLEANDYDAIDQIYPDPTGPNAVPPPPNPKMLEIQLKEKVLQQESQLKIIELQLEAELNKAKITELEAKATQHLAEAQGVETGHQIALIEAQIGAAKTRQEHLLKSIDLMQKILSSNQQSGDSHGSKSESGMGTKSPDASISNPSA